MPISLGMALDVPIPRHHPDMNGLSWRLDLGAIGLGVATMTLFGADRSEELRL